MALASVYVLSFYLSKVVQVLITLSGMCKYMRYKKTVSKEYSFYMFLLYKFRKNTMAA